MKLSNDSNVFSAESCLFVIILISLTYNITLVYQSNPDFIHQFETFEELIEATIRCDFSHDEASSTIINSTDTDYISSYTTVNSSTLPKCPIDRDRLKHFNDYELNTWLNYRHIQLGGQFKPIGCKSMQRVAIVIPYRDRQEQLEKFSLYIHQFLPDQLVEYSLYVIEQSDDKPFDRAKLFNVGVTEINKLDNDICCFIFHNVDLLPLDQRNLYMCSARPRHLSPSISTQRFKLLHPSTFDGVISMTKNQFVKRTVFSNDSFYCGVEEDCMFRRVRAAGYEIERSPKQYGVYNKLKQIRMKPNPSSFQLTRESIQNVNDGVQVTASGTTYKVEKITKEQLFTIISIEL